MDLASAASNPYIVSAVISSMTAVIYAILMKIRKMTNSEIQRNSLIVGVICFAVSLGWQLLTATPADELMQVPYHQESQIV